MSGNLNYSFPYRSTHKALHRPVIRSKNTFSLVSGLQKLSVDAHTHTNRCTNEIMKDNASLL